MIKLSVVIEDFRHLKGQMEIFFCEGRKRFGRSWLNSRAKRPGDKNFNDHRKMAMTVIGCIDSTTERDCWCVVHSVCTQCNVHCAHWARVGHADSGSISLACSDSFSAQSSASASSCIPIGRPFMTSHPRRPPIGRRWRRELSRAQQSGLA